MEDRLGLCRKAICKWSRTFQENSRKSLEGLHNQLDDVMSNPIPNDDLIHNINSNMLLVYKLEEEYWKQRSRQLWLTLGDSNKNYFHATTKVRKSKNWMNVNENDAGITWFEEKHIAKVICNYYENLFTSSQLENLHIVEEALRYPTNQWNAFQRSISGGN